MIEWLIILSIYWLIGMVMIIHRERQFSNITVEALFMMVGIAWWWPLLLMSSKLKFADKVVFKKK